MPYRDLVVGQGAGRSLSRVVCFLRHPDLLLQPARGEESGRQEPLEQMTPYRSQ